MNVKRHEARGERRRPRYWRLRAVVRITAEALVTLADHVLPKRGDTILIGSNHGQSFNGNAYFLFLYLIRSNRGHVRVVTSSPEVRATVESLSPGSSLSSYSLRTLWSGLRSRSLCFTHTRSDLGILKYLRGPRFVYLNHGIPLKAMGYNKAYNDPFIKRHGSSFRAITCCSDFEASRWRESYRLPPSRTWVTGSARNDQLWSRRDSVLVDLGVEPGRPVVLYAPTFRETGALETYLPTPDLDVDELESVLERFDATLLVRAHPLDSAAAAASLGTLRSSRIIIADRSRVDDVHELLPSVDILIADYSSIYLDFLLLDRPIIFSCYDLDAYQQSRGLSMDYFDHTPGQHVRDGQEFLHALATELEGHDPAAAERTRIRSLFHAHTDDGSCARIADQLLN